MDAVATLVDLGGFAYRATLLRSGLTQHAVHRGCRQGRIVRVHRGVYGVGLAEGIDALRPAAAAICGAIVSHDSGRGSSRSTSCARQRTRAEARARHGYVASCDWRIRLRVSVLESMLRVLLVQHGLAPDCAQYPVRDEHGVRVGWVDFAYIEARRLVEADGFEFHRDRNDYRKDRRRANAYCRLDWRLLRFSWEDVRLEPEYVVDAVRCELGKATRSRRPRGN